MGYAATSMLARRHRLPLVPYAATSAMEAGRVSIEGRGRPLLLLNGIGASLELLEGRVVDGVLLLLAEPPDFGDLPRIVGH